MTENLEIYKCEVCGIVAEVLEGGAGDLVCCGTEMALQQAKTADAATEKHVPIIEPGDGEVTVVVGSTPHPMEDKHYIQWIELTSDGQTTRRMLKPGDDPKAVFTGAGKDLTAREHCNLHGLWKG